MKFRRMIVKMAVALMVIGVGAVGAVVPASPAVANCEQKVTVSKPYKLHPSSTDIYARFSIEMSGCGTRYWTENSYLDGPRSTGRTVTYQGDRYYSVVLRVSSCRTGTYRASLHIIGDGFDLFREASRYIRC
ncbi:hypothetical protein [Glycomyces salinus]|uniref:hypothetical protein n=1 Tax=Glycomyces salinus TaxID=980294 RepID=UPI0018ECA6F2|nr:hypothetical protein [Glycomyces salinus]